MKKLLLLPALAFCGGAIWVSAAPLPDQARDWRAELAAKVLPYWFDTAQDKTHGGYLLADDGRGGGRATEKQLVGQSRMVWGFAHAHRNGFSTPQRNYLQAARQGYDFLIAHFRDAKDGGYYWTTDLAGQVLNPRKILYGEAFVIYALVEYHRASGDPAPLRHALGLYRALQQHAHDDRHQGWFEHFTRDWHPILSPAPEAPVEVPGYKSANAHLHLMEALTELYAVSRDPAVKQSLIEAVKLNAKYFYPLRAGRSCFHRQPDWQPVTDPKSAGLSYGHNVEFAWLMIHAQQVLGQRPAWKHFQAHLRHALRYGYDHEHGGLYRLGRDNQPAHQTDKVWWVQAELVAVLTEALQHQATPDYAAALEQSLQFIQRYLVDPVDGIWRWSVAADGTVLNPGKANSWKANYHDVRAMLKFIDAFEPP